MASIIRVRRSTGKAAPSTINFGELAVTVGIGTYSDLGDRFFVGNNDSPDPNPIEIGGKYYTDMMQHKAGLVAGVTNPGQAVNGFVAMCDQERKVDQWNVDNLRLDANTLSSTNTDGAIYLDPNGSGEVIIPDDTYLTFGDSGDTKIKYDETTDDRLEVTGADWDFANGVALILSDVTDSTTKDNGALIVQGGAGIEKSVNIGGNISVGGATTLASAGGITTTGGDMYIGGDLYVLDDIKFDEMTVRNILVTGISTFQGQVNITNAPLVMTGGKGAVIDAIGISSNVISTKSGAGNVLYIDPYPDGLSNEGTVVVKGDLQVDGTTTSVNSSTVTVNDPIFNIGDVTSKRTVMQAVGAGASAIVLDSITGIYTGNTITGSSSLPGAGTTTIHSYNSGSKTIYIDGVTTAGIVTTTQLTVTQAYDTNDDRGISFDYNAGGGVSGNKTGFFGWEDSSQKWTFVPDATISNNIVTGTKGFLDIKGIYYQSGDFATSGVVYFDSTGLQNSTVAPASGISTSNYVLTTTAAGVPTWTTTLDGGTF